MELRKNESIFRVGAWPLAYWKAPWLLKALGGTATIEEIAEQAQKDYPDADFTKSIKFGQRASRKSTSSTRT